MASGVYRIVNTQTDKVYIGSCINFDKRKMKHFHELRKGVHVNPHLQSSWNIYGEGSFVFEILECCPVESLIETEQRYLDSSVEELYNIRLVAHSNFGLKMSEETKIKMSESGKAKVFTEEHKANISRAKKGWAPNQGKTLSDEHKAKLRTSNTGQVRSEESRRKMSEAAKRRKTKNGC